MANINILSANIAAATGLTKSQFEGDNTFVLAGVIVCRQLRVEILFLDAF